MKRKKPKKRIVSRETRKRPAENRRVAPWGVKEKDMGCMIKGCAPLSGGFGNADTVFDRPIPLGLVEFCLDPGAFHS